MLYRGPLKALASAGLLVKQFLIQRCVLHRPRHTSAGLQTSKAAICSGEGKESKFPSEQAVTVSKKKTQPGRSRSSARHSPGSGLSGHRSASGQKDIAAAAVRARHAPPPAATPGSASLGQGGAEGRRSSGRYFLRREAKPNFLPPSPGIAAGPGAALTSCLPPGSGSTGRGSDGFVARLARSPYTGWAGGS